MKEIFAGTPVEAVARLFSSLTWSEEFYKIRARDTLLRLAEIQMNNNQRLTLQWLKEALASAGSLMSFLGTSGEIAPPNRPVKPSAMIKYFLLILLLLFRM
jgi:hypothetical protein